MIDVPKDAHCTGQRNGWTLKKPWGDLSDTARHYYYIFLAVVFFAVAQLLTCAWDMALWTVKQDFPGQVVAMIFVWLLMWTVQVVFFRPGEGLESFYHCHLKPPTEILNKHMSIGFTVPFLPLISQSFVGAEQIGLLTTAFALTGVLNSIFVYVIAYYIQCWITKLVMKVRPSANRAMRHRNDLEVESVQHESHIHVNPPQLGLMPHEVVECAAGGPSCVRMDDDVEQSCLDPSRKHLSDVSTLCTLSGYASDSNGPNAADEADAQATCGALPKDALRILEDGTRSTDAAASLSMTASRRIILATRVWIQHHVFLILSILLFLVLGVPLSYLRDNDLFLDTGFLFIMWLTFTSAQARLKQHITSHMQQRHYHPQQAQQRSVGLTALATLLNPVLWTSLFLVCYGFAKSCIRQEPTALVVARFKTNNTISDIIAHHIDLFDISPSSTSLDALASSNSSSSPHTMHFTLGAGDIATSILNAGIVSWGLKLFEYRHQIVSRGGLTVLITSSIVAIFNIIAWPLLAHRIGVRPAASNLSFAARSVTIALSIPAMGSLGGDASVNAVGVVVNGICFQLAAGFLVGGQGIHSAMGRWCMVARSWMWTIVGTSRNSQGAEVSFSREDKANNRLQTQSPAGFSNRLARLSDEDNHHRHTRHNSNATHIEGRHASDSLDFAHETVPTCSAGRCRTDDDAAKHHERQQTELTLAHGDDLATVAAGVTIGINAAAMGTAHLYEQNRKAAPYSALSMTMFGIFTVLFTVSSPMVEWLVASVGGGS